MKATRKIAKLLAPALLLTFVSGCATPALWSNEKMEAWNKAANSSNIRLFATKDQNDFLVVYDEYSERSHVSRTRAYWLNKNDKRIEKSHRPFFVSPGLATSLAPVPVFPSVLRMSDTPPLVYATISPRSFVLCRGEKSTKHDLPEYNDGRGIAEKIFFTPPAVAFDAAIVCGYAAALYYGNK